MVTDGSQPIGNGVGSALEARIVWLLKRDARIPLDLEKSALQCAQNIFKMMGIKDGAKKQLKCLIRARLTKKWKR